MRSTVFFRNFNNGKPTKVAIHGFTHGVAFLAGSQWTYTGIDTVLANSWPIPGFCLPEAEVHFRFIPRVGPTEVSRNV
jgi:hypothetical protein